MVKFSWAKAKHLRLGITGENKACALLRSKNADIICRNYKVKAGEIDIVARDGGMLVFAEVKTRRHTSRSRPAEGLSLKQKKRIYRAAMNYLNAIDRPHCVFRFDLIEIVASPFRLHEVRHWQNHFSAKNIFPNYDK
ncbi:MAG: YraN family protein [Victivallaceae bacterium]